MKNNIKNNFNKAAKIYNQNAILQKQVASDLIDFCLPYLNNSSKIIDLGSGTGFLYDLISQKQQITNFFALDLANSIMRLKISSPSLAASQALTISVQFFGEINFFIAGDDYNLLGVIPANLKFYYSEKPFFLFGGDRLGRDLYTRTMIGM